MKLNLRKVGEITKMEAEGTPEEIATFVKLLDGQQPAVVASQNFSVDVSGCKGVIPDFVGALRAAGSVPLSR